MEWTPNEMNGLLDARVVAGADSCGDCLVQRELTLVMLNNSASISLRYVTLVDESVRSAEIIRWRSIVDNGCQACV